MTLYEKIQDDIKTAMKGKDMKTLDALRTVLAGLKNKVIELKRDLEDAEVVAAIRTDVKKLVDALGDFKKAARKDLVDKTEAEIKILKSYLPPEMGDKELREVVGKKITEMDVDDLKKMGQVMGAVMADLKDKVDGSRVKKMVEDLLKKKKK